MAKRLPLLGIRLVVLVMAIVILAMAMAWNVATGGLGQAASSRVNDYANAGRTTYDSMQRSLQTYSAQIAKQLTGVGVAATSALAGDATVLPSDQFVGMATPGVVLAYRSGAPLQGESWIAGTLRASRQGAVLGSDTNGVPWLVVTSPGPGGEIVFIAQSMAKTFQGIGVVTRDGRVVTTGPFGSASKNRGTVLDTSLNAALDAPGRTVSASLGGGEIRAQAFDLGNRYQLLVASTVGTPAGFIPTFLFFGTLILTALLLMLFLVDRELSRPLRLLQRAVARIGEGRLDTEIAPGPNNEIGQLASDIDAARARLRETARQTATRAFVASQLNEATSLDDTMQTIAQFVRENCDADIAVITTRSDGAEREFPAVAGQAGVDLGVLGRALDGDRALHRDDPHAVVIDTADNSPFVQTGMAYWCVAPLLVDGHAGAIALGANRHRFTAADADVVTAAGENLSGALTRQRLVQAENAQRVAEDASRAKSEYLSRMSHELRTPLTAIIGYADLLSLRIHSGEESEWLQAITTSSDHLLTLIDDLLDIARIEAGRETFSVEPVTLRELLDDCLALIAPAAARSHITLHYDAPGDEVKVMADRQRLRQVFLNLLSNGVKYGSSPGHIWVTVTHRRGGQVRTTFKDTGPGIPANRLPYLFQPFERLGAERSRVSGTGLGLAVSRRLIEGMGGRIGVSSRAGAGSRFWVQLATATASQTVEEEPAQAVPRQADSRGRKTILSIEDNPATQEVIAKVLANRPEVRLITAPDGITGLELAREHAPDLILLDLHLPDMDGEEVLGILKRDPLTDAIPVLALSADATQHRMNRLLNEGVRAYITKPFRVRKFLEILDTELSIAEDAVEAR